MTPPVSPPSGARLSGPLLLAALVLAPAALAQQPRPAASAVPAGPNAATATLAPLALPTPNAYRSADGRPGPDYWQQRADYRIRASLSPGAHRLAGTVTIRYTNNSPEPLSTLWLQAEQNLFRPGSLGASVQPANSRWRGSFADGGLTLGNTVVRQGGGQYVPSASVEDTRLRIALREPLAAKGGTAEIAIDYSFVVPQYGADRMGRFESAQGTVYELAQWYPRMYVYDDVNGWNPLPYYGQGEFHLSYGDYDVELTVPADMIVSATGTLVNPADVLTAEQQRRFTQAKTSDETVVIVPRAEIGDASARPRGTNGLLTWKFRAENVRDFAWAASRAFIWDAARAKAGAAPGARDVLVQSFYPPEGVGTAGQATEGWERSTQMMRHSMAFYSAQWFPYPYPVYNNVAGVVGGMEYPMLSFCGVRARGPGLFGVTDHEFGHSWFPMVVGSDERRHAWMDEGFNTFINRYSNLAFYGAEAQRAARTGAEGIAAASLSPAWDQPVMTYPDLIRREGLGMLAYSKPGAGLVLLREYVLGPERFDPAFRAYIDRWAFKHPQPADFFRSMEDGTGEDLDWFWRGWFGSTESFDQAITDVQAQGDTLTNVTVRNLRGLVFPTTLEVTFADGTTARQRIPVVAYGTSPTFAYPVSGTQRVRGVRLDPDGWLPDVDRTNDTWGQPASAAGMTGTAPASPRTGTAAPRPRGRTGSRN